MSNFYKGKRVLVTGANGFLGSHLSIALLKEGASVIGIIKEEPRDSFLKIALKEIKKPKISLTKSDIVNFNSTLNIFKKHRPDICLHIAAQPIVGIANKSPLPTFESNIKGTWNILEIARICLTKAMVVASSDKAYGEHKKLPYTEDASLLALHPYDASKACADILSRTYAHTYNLAVAVIRCANIYGPGDLNFSRIIPDTLRSVILHRNPVIRSDGTPLTDYVFIDDIVDGYLKLAKQLYLKKDKVSGQAFNLGSGKPISVLKLVNSIIRISKAKNLRPRILNKGKIKGEIDRQYLNSRKARKLLGWYPRCVLKMGLGKTLKWYKEYLLHNQR